MDSTGESYIERISLDAPLFPRNGKGQSIFLAELVGLPDDISIADAPSKCLEERWEALEREDYKIQLEMGRIKTELNHREGKF